MNGLIITAAAAAALCITLLCAILACALDIKRLLGEMLEEGYVRYMTDEDTPFEEDGGALEQKRWEEGVANLLSYMGGVKDGEAR